jgi:hypothetical protein
LDCQSGIQPGGCTGSFQNYACGGYEYASWKSSSRRAQREAQKGAAQELTSEARIGSGTLTKGIGLFGFFLTAICAMNSVALTLMVLFRRRPASLNVIALHAAVLFSLPAIRASIPGAPKLGVTLDAVAFFPAVVIVVASLIVSSILWSTRSDAVSQ